MTGLYIHIPICVSKCSYCDFYSVTSGDENLVDRFLTSLELELQRLPASFAPETIFIGGGTPTALDAPQIYRLMDMVRERINLSRVIEYSCEANPGTLSLDKLSALRDGGVNRMSLGVQTFHDRALKLLGRIHSSDEAIRGVQLLRETGFDNISIDMIQSIPGMTPKDVLADVAQVVAMDPEHISYYNLIFEPDTPMTADRDRGVIKEMGDDEEADNYFAVRSALATAGFEQYEISNFAKAGRESRHNMLYWLNEEYLGTGPSAHSHWAGARFGNVRDLSEYCARLSRNERPFDELETLDPASKAREALVMGLRLLRGVDLIEFKAGTGFDVADLYDDELTNLLDQKLLKRAEDRLHLTDSALFVSNHVFSELI